MRTTVFIALICITVFGSCNKDPEKPNPNPTSTLLDDRDGQEYSTVFINGHWWMSENLDVGKVIDESADATDNGIIEKYYYDNDSTLGEIHGGLYTWNEMMEYTIEEGVQGICPDGWHIPSNAEWQSLLDQYPDCPDLRLEGLSGFNGLLSGGRNRYNNFNNLGELGIYWSSTKKHVYSAHYYLINLSNQSVISDLEDRISAFSVRCIMDTIAR